jgi:hypothetical protein
MERKSESPLNSGLHPGNRRFFPLDRWTSTAGRAAGEDLMFLLKWNLRMLDEAQRRGVRLDTVQMPLNVMDARFRSFECEVLPRLVREEIGVLGMKPLGSGEMLQSGTVTAFECLHRAAPADGDRHHGHRQPGAPGPGVRGRAHLQATRQR